MILSCFLTKYGWGMRGGVGGGCWMLDVKLIISSHWSNSSAQTWLTEQTHLALAQHSAHQTSIRWGDTHGPDPKHLELNNNRPVNKNRLNQHRANGQSSFLAKTPDGNTPISSNTLTTKLSRSLFVLSVTPNAVFPTSACSLITHITFQRRFILSLQGHCRLPVAGQGLTAGWYECEEWNAPQHFSKTAAWARFFTTQPCEWRNSMFFNTEPLLFQQRDLWNNQANKYPPSCCVSVHRFCTEWVTPQSRNHGNGQSGNL